MPRSAVAAPIGTDGTTDEESDPMPLEIEPSRYWIVVGSIDNFRRTADRGFTLQGLKSRHRRKAERMMPGDKIVYYLTGLKAFGAIVTVASPFFESHEPIWRSGDPKKEAEDYPFRVEIQPDVVLDESEFVPAEGVARRMAYVSKWPAENWTLAFQGNVHEIGRDDYQLIRDAMEARVPAGALDGRGDD